MTGPVNIQPPGLDIRIEVNPNAYHHKDPDKYIARFREANRVPAVGDEVTVIQPDDDPAEPEYVSTAEILEVDQDHGLIVMRVDWKGFHDALPSSPVTVNYSEARLIS
jgi:hypothetical protein